MIDFNPTEKCEINTNDKLFLGCYVEGIDSLHDAQLSTMERLIKLTPKLKKSSKILFLNDDYIFGAFYIATVYNSKVHILCSTSDKQEDIVRQAANNNISAYIQTSVGEPNYLNFDFDFFDFVWSVNALTNREDLLPIMREIKGVLAPQGRLILLEELLAPDNTTLSHSNFHTFLDILKLASAGDLEKISQIILSAESEVHYQKLAENNNLEDSVIEHIHLHKKMTEDGLICWNFIQFQKRNA